MEGQPALRFALAYGFRNIQTLLRKVKQGACQYDYVEVMACPSGCVNGGGQLRPGNGKAAQQLIAEVDAAYHHPEVPLPRLELMSLHSRCVRSAAAECVSCIIYMIPLRCRQLQSHGSGCFRSPNCFDCPGNCQTGISGPADSRSSVSLRQFAVDRLSSGGRRTTLLFKCCTSSGSRAQFCRRQHEKCYIRSTTSGRRLSQQL